MIILVLNCGSSSIKYQVIDMKSAGDWALLAKGLIERIGLAEGALIHKPVGKAVYEIHQPIPDHTVGISLIIEALVNAEHGVIESLEQLAAVGHRVVHGGEYFAHSVLVDDDVIEKIRSCFELAPLHNPANVEGILSMQKLLPGIPQVAVFDTSFHATIPADNYLYAIPSEYYEKYRVRKFGFHGTSHRFVAEQGAKLAGLDINNSKIITLHVGNGASATAVWNGKSFDTSMGFTTVDGLMMGTRCGELDPGALVYIAEREGMSYAEMSDLINKKSGIQGMTGISSDMRDIDAAVEAGDPKAIVGRNLYFRRVKKFVGSYAAEMGGVDLIVFTGGVGENSPQLRESVCTDMEYMGIKFDSKVNDGLKGKDMILSTPDSKVKVVVLSTNEELVIATDTFHLATGK